MFCQNCGAKVIDGSKFCENCGTPLIIPQDAGRKEEKEAFENGRETVPGAVSDAQPVPGAGNAFAGGKTPVGEQSGAAGAGVGASSTACLRRCCPWPCLRMASFPW